jgi:excinuclease ABC subunit C
MLQRMRDEAHRFAITYNRKRRSMRTVTSELLKIRGVGPEKRRALLNAFGSIQGVRDAGVEAIAGLPGFSLASAQRLLTALAPSEPVPSAAEPETAVAPLPPRDTEQG